MRRLLITGGAGFIGSNFTHYWLEKYPSDHVLVFDALTYAGTRSSIEDLFHLPNFTFVQGDIRNPAAVKQVMQGVDWVVHFAAETHVDRSINNPDDFLTTNILGTHVLLKAALEAKIQRFHHISTDEVFGTLSLDSNDKFTLESPYAPHSPYSASKAASDHLVRAYTDTYGLPTTITNCSNNYGPYQFPEKMIPLAITKLLSDQPVPIYGDGSQVRDWLYVSDHCRAIELTLLHGHAGETYLVGGPDQRITNLELIKMLLVLMNKPNDQYEFVADRPGHDLRYAIDWSQTQQKLNWQPTVTLQDGLAKTLEWYLKHEGWWRPLLTQ